MYTTFGLYLFTLAVSCNMHKAMTICETPTHIHTQAPRLSAQYAFVSFLGSICRKMIKHTTRELRSE